MGPCQETRCGFQLLSNNENSVMPDIDAAVDCVKNIVDNIKCPICDNLGEKRYRYSCGHLTCDDCTTKNDCLLCLTPPLSDPTPTFDELSTRQLKNGVALLHAFQDTFNIDVYKRHRISGQLKIEKELFPKCIQAPSKYYNKRKSIGSALLGKNEKRKRYIIPGQAIQSNSSTNMDKSRTAYVQHWLNESNPQPPLKNTTRKPFTDLKVNNANTNFNQTLKSLDKIKGESKQTISKNSLKRKSIRKVNVSSLESQSCLENYLKPVTKGNTSSWKTKKLKKEFEKVCKTSNITTNNESGIVLDDEPIVIDDSQSQVIDKDALAWRAVLEADEVCSTVCSNSIENSYVDVPNNNKHVTEKAVTQNLINLPHKVPFYKKGYIVEICKDCISDQNTCNDNNIIKQNSDVSVTIDSKTLLTIIKVNNCEGNSMNLKKSSTSTQTDISDMSNKVYLTYDIENKETLSKDLFTFDENACSHGNQTTEKRALKRKSRDSQDTEKLDTDIDLEIKNAEITNSKFKQGVLTELKPRQCAARTKRAPRGHTPNSSDSSDKENYDPNRAKKRKIVKKSEKK